MEARCGTVFRIFPVKLVRLDQQDLWVHQGQRDLRERRLEQEPQVQREQWVRQGTRVPLAQQARLLVRQVQRVRLEM